MYRTEAGKGAGRGSPIGASGGMEYSTRLPSSFILLLMSIYFGVWEGCKWCLDSQSRRFGLWACMTDLKKRIHITDKRGSKNSLESFSRCHPAAPFIVFFDSNVQSDLPPFLRSDLSRRSSEANARAYTCQRSTRLACPVANHTIRFALTSGVTDPITHWKPPGHVWQSSTEAAPVVLRYVPTGHSSGSVSRIRQKKPAGHGY